MSTIFVSHQLIQVIQLLQRYSKKDPSWEVSSDPFHYCSLRKVYPPKRWRYHYCHLFRHPFVPYIKFKKNYPEADNCVEIGKEGRVAMGWTETSSMQSRFLLATLPFSAKKGAVGFWTAVMRFWLTLTGKERKYHFKDRVCLDSRSDVCVASNTAGLSPQAHNSVTVVTKLEL